MSDESGESDKSIRADAILAGSIAAAAISLVALLISVVAWSAYHLLMG
jgi:hypothetical protein